RLAEHEGQLVNRRLQLRRERLAQQQRLRRFVGAAGGEPSRSLFGGAIDELAVDRDGVAGPIAGAVAGGVVENREQPGSQVRAGLELTGGSERLEIRF